MNRSNYNKACKSQAESQYKVYQSKFKDSYEIELAMAEIYFRNKEVKNALNRCFVINNKFGTMKKSLELELNCHKSLENKEDSKRVQELLDTLKKGFSAAS